MQGRGAVIVGFFLVLSACGTERPSVGTPPDDPLEYMTYSCDGDERAYRVSEPYRLNEVPDGAERALERIQRNWIESVGPKDAAEWDAVFRTNKTVVFLYERGGGRFPYSEVEVRRRSNRGWGFGGLGDCQLWATPREGWPSAEWSLIEDPHPDGREIEFFATENGCSGGRKLAPEDFRSFVHYEDGRISVAVYSEPIAAGYHTCIGNPSTKVTLELDEPVGERAIYDVGRYPSQLETKSGEQ